MINHRMTLASFKKELKTLPPDMVVHESYSHCAFDTYLERQGVEYPRVYSSTYTFDIGAESYSRPLTPLIREAIARIDQASNEQEDTSDLTATQVLQAIEGL